MPYSGRVRAWTLNGDVSTDELAAALHDPEHSMWARVVDYGETANTVVNLGRESMTKLIVAESTRVASHIALSTTSAVTPSPADTVATIPNRICTVGLTIAESYALYSQRYVAYFTTTSFGSTGVAIAGLLDSASTSATTNLWADAAVTVSKSTAQSMVLTWLITTST